MNTQNFVEEKQPKLKFPVGALLLLILQANCLVRAITSGDHFSFLLEPILISAVAVVLLVKKRGLAPLVSLGVWLVWSSIDSMFSNWWGSIFYLPFLSTVVLLYLFDFVPALKSKKKIVSIAFYVFFAIYGVYSLINNISSLGVYFLTNNISFFVEGMAVYSLIHNIVFLIAWLLIGLYIINPYQKIREPKEGGASENAYGDEFYVSLSKHVCLLLFTCGIWMYIWIYKATKFTNLYAGEEERNPVSTLLLCMFVPFYSIYWTYKTALRIDAMAKENNISSDLGTACLILAIFVGIIPPVLMQEKINELAQKN